MLIKQLLNVFVSTAVADGLLGPIYGIIMITMPGRTLSEFANVDKKKRGLPGSRSRCWEGSKAWLGSTTLSPQIISRR